MIEEQFKEFLLTEMKKDEFWKNLNPENVYLTLFRVCSKIDNVQSGIVVIKESEFNSLYQDADSFNKLLAAGVDNWEGYDQAMQEDD